MGDVRVEAPVLGEVRATGPFQFTETFHAINHAPVVDRFLTATERQSELLPTSRQGMQFSREELLAV